MSDDELKARVSLMRDLGVAAFKVDNLEVSFWQGGATPALGAIGASALPEEEPMTEEQRKIEFEKLLYHSAI